MDFFKDFLKVLLPLICVIIGIHYPNFRIVVVIIAALAYFYFKSRSKD